MATIKTWQENLEKKSVAEVEVLQNALRALKGWDLFDKEYSRLSFIRLLIITDLRCRERK